jgi:P4 family phage/plasmid primase-like protien
MTIYNQLYTDLQGFDLGDHISRYGPPHWPTKSNPVGVLNEAFWAALVAELNYILFENRENEFYKYNSRIYERLSAHLLFQQISNDILRASGIWPGYEPLAQLRNAKHISGVVAHFKGYAQKEEAFRGNAGLIHVANGVLKLDGAKVELLPFSPDLISRNLIPIAYDPKAKCPRFKNELLGLLDQDDQQLLQKFLGLYLLGRNIIQKLLILHGIGETGKSTFSEVARKLIGPENCSELRTNLLHERFEIGSFIGKHLLIGADVASSFLNSKGAYRIKAIIGGDLLDAERKGSNHRFQLPGDFNVLITSNSRQTARIEQDRSAWQRRLAIVEYEKPRTSKVIPEFAELLIREEGSGILSEGVEGLLKLQADIKEYGTLQLSKRQKERVESLLNESDGLRMFLESAVESDASGDLTSAEILQRYSGYCLDRGWAMSTRKAESELTDLMVELFQAVRSNNIERGKTKVRGYRGVGFKDENEGSDTDENDEGDPDWSC